MLLDSGEWYTDPYKRFGIYMEKNFPRVNVWAGKNGLGGGNLIGNFTPKPEIYYSLLMALLPDGEFWVLFGIQMILQKQFTIRENR